ncbi:MAG: cache domain-containing protein [Methanospirillaceae archaeon]|nr:cache domain-containing protein [Methanospirillaceae archaeon]
MNNDAMVLSALFLFVLISLVSVVHAEMNDPVPGDPLVFGGMSTETGEFSGNSTADIAELTRFVDDAVRYAGEVGRDEACTTFNNVSGPYVTDSRYIYAYDMNHITLSMPFEQDYLGKSRKDIIDASGVAIIQSVVDLAKEGGGFMYTVYKNPAEGYQNQFKILYFKPVDPEWFVGSGLYIPGFVGNITPEERTLLQDRVLAAVDHAGIVGKEQAIQEFNDLSGPFSDREGYIFAYDYDGNTLALPHQPELIGTNRMLYTDLYGCPIIFQEIKTAQRGGGYVNVVYYNPETGKDEPKLCYVLPAGDDWLIGSGIYIGAGPIKE